jgi:hypothetical protein
MRRKLSRPQIAGILLAALALSGQAVAQSANPKFKTLYNFTGTPDGYAPTDLVLGEGGALYGATEHGGTATACNSHRYTGCGTVFALTPPTAAGERWTETALYNFQDDGDGAFPEGMLAVGGNGEIYGTTISGGERSSAGCGGLRCGTVFELMPPAVAGGPWTEKAIYKFNGRSDGGPTGGLIIDKGGTLYLTTGASGPTSAACENFGCGSVLELTPPKVAGGRWTKTVLYNFTGPPGDGLLPRGLLFGAGGVLYGTTFFGGSGSGLYCSEGQTIGCGTAFELKPPSEAGGAWSETVLYSFTDHSDGGYPNPGLVLGPDGALYGTALDGGGSASGSYGVVFELIPPSDPTGAWTETVLHAFGTVTGDGSQPDALAAGSNGTLIGTTLGGGPAPDASGTAFELTPPATPGDPWTETFLHTFIRHPRFGIGQTALTRDKSGVLYGATQFGGPSPCALKRHEQPGCGTVFALRP